jgi:hypothetical protein
MAKQLYIVRIEHEFMLVADSPGEALAEASYHQADVLSSEGTTPDVSPADGRRAKGYDRHTIPWGGEDERTVGDYEDGK